MMRTVVDALGRAGLSWYITGSAALAAYASPRQTMDIDIVVDATVDELASVARSFADAYYYSEPARFEDRTMAALVDLRGAGKVDLIVRDPDAWGRTAMERRRRWEDPALGQVWISSLEDLILAKLEWSGGTSELQLRDCWTLLRMNAVSLDDGYLDRWAQALGVGALLARARERADAY